MLVSFRSKKISNVLLNKIFWSNPQIRPAKVSNSSIDKNYKHVAGKILFCSMRDGENVGHIIQNLVILFNGES